MRKKRVEFIRTDKRGKLIQLITEKFKQLNILEMVDKTLWGGHYHKNRYEFFHVLDGAISLRIRKNGCNIETDFIKGESFMIEPFEVHEIVSRVEYSRLLVGYSRAFDPNNPDIHKDAVVA